VLVRCWRAETAQESADQRTAHLHDHAGQISFPGGRVENMMPCHGTALRERAGGSGFAALECVESSGSLLRYTTATGYEVTLSPV
jgi:hypothetical protein